MLTTQAAGGTNQPGVDADLFVIDADRRIRYDVPCRLLADYVTGYAIYISDRREPLVNWYLPAPPIMTILLDAGPLSVNVRNRSYPCVDQASLWGPMSHAYRTTTHGGISVGIGLTALGWMRLTRAPADAYRDRLTPLAAMIPPALVTSLVQALESLDDDADIAGVLDRVLLDLFRIQVEHPEHVEGLSRLVLTNGIISVDDVADRLSVDTRTLRRIAARSFGMPSKALLVRARFVRSFVGWLALGEPPSYAGIDSSYFDASHFLLDSQKFLGTTPRRFARGETSYLRASLRARAAVLGAAAHVLHAA